MTYSTSSLFQKWLNDMSNNLCTYISHLNMVISIFEYKQSSSWLPRFSLPSVATTNEIHSFIELCFAKFHLGVWSIRIYTFYLYTMTKSTVPIHQPCGWEYFDVWRMMMYLKCYRRAYIKSSLNLSSQFSILKYTTSLVI